MPKIMYQDGSALRDMQAIYYQDGANLRLIREAYYQDGATLRKVWPPVAALDGSVGNIIGTTAYNPRPIRWPVGTTGASVTGGTPPYSYLWSLTGTVGNFVISSPNSTSSTVEVSHPINVQGSFSCTIQCQITDAASNTITRTGTVTFGVL